MIVFADTSALFGLMAQNDRIHEEAKQAFNYLGRQEAMLVTSSYVLVETIALLQNRVGLAAVQDFYVKLQPLLEIIWVDERWHQRAMQRLLSSQRRKLSLVDCVSFEIIEMKKLDYAFAFDEHFEQEGIPVVLPPRC
jgi:predicted nucleic acid-binding protein